MAKKHWTDKENEILLNEISKNADNFRAAFENTAKKINRTPGSVTTHWYKHIRTNSEAETVLASKHKYAVNSKNSNRKRDASGKLKKNNKNFISYNKNNNKNEGKFKKIIRIIFDLN